MDVQSVLYIRIDGDLLVYCAEVTDNFSSQHLLPVGRRDVEATPTKPLRSIPVGSPRAKPKKDATLDSLPREYQTMLYELEEQSSRIDEEIKRISQKNVQKTQTKKTKRKVPAPKIDELSDDEPVCKESPKKKKSQGQSQGQGQGQEKDKNRFGKFFQKLKKPKKSFRKEKGQSQKVQSDSDNASELSTDFEAYLMMTDSDVDSRESPTELLHEVAEQERERKRKERLKEVEDEVVTTTRVSGAESAPKHDDPHYDSGGGYSEGELADYEAGLNEPVEIPLSTLLESSDQVIRIKTPASMPANTRLRISTQIVNEEGEVLSESTEDVSPRGIFTGVHHDTCKAGHPQDPTCTCPCHEKKYHLIHHHVHHHVGEEEKKVKLEGGVEAPPYSSEAPPIYTPVAVGSEAHENTGLLQRRDAKARWRWLCCQCYRY
jgi:hypothetical protein